jgi:hypothetical protein
MATTATTSQMRSIDAYYDILMKAIPKASSSKSTEILTELQFYINGMILQWNRIVQDSLEETAGLRAMANKGRVNTRATGQTMTTVRLDVQLLVIILDKVTKLMKAFEREENDILIWKRCKEVEKTLASLSDARDSIEHFDYDLSSGSGRPRGLSLGPGGLMFNFTRAPRRKRKVAKAGAIFLGYDQLSLILKSFEQIISTLEKRTQVP